jgi:hypothetical protein
MDASSYILFASTRIRSAIGSLDWFREARMAASPIREMHSEHRWRSASGM